MASIDSVSDGERPDVSGPVRSIKMYSHAQCTMQERSVCSRDVPCLAHMELGSVPLHPAPTPPPYLPGVMGTQFTGSLQEGWTWTVDWRFQQIPNTDPVILDNVRDIIFIPSRKLFLECLSNDCLVVLIAIIFLG